MLAYWVVADPNRHDRIAIAFAQIDLATTNGAIALSRVASRLLDTFGTDVGYRTDFDFKSTVIQYKSATVLKRILPRANVLRVAADGGEKLLQMLAAQDW
jgi:hypothetical protein